MTGRPEIVSFGYRSAADRRQLKRFVAFHWTHYRDDPRYVPLLDFDTSVPACSGSRDSSRRATCSSATATRAFSWRSAMETSLAAATRL